MAQQPVDQTQKKEIPLNGKLITAEDGILCGTNFKTLKNLRYTDARPKAIRGMTKMNTTALASPHVRSAFHFRKDQPQESHILVQALDTNDANPKVYRNDTAIPAVGDFTSAVLHTDNTAAERGYFASAPNGNVVYCNSSESLIWGGNEMRLGAFINYDPDSTFKYDFSEVLQNTLSDSDNIATLHGVTSSGIDSYTKLLLHFDNDVTDYSTTGKVVTNTAVTFDSSVYKFGGYSGLFDGATAFLSVPDHADFDFSAGIWTIDTWLQTDDLSADQCLYSQRTDANNWMRIYIDTNGTLALKINLLGVESTIITTASGAIEADTMYHIEVSESGDDYRLFINGQLNASASSASRPGSYGQSVYIGCHHDNAATTDYLNGYLDEFRVSKTIRHTETFEVPASAYSAGTGGTGVYCYVGSTRPIYRMKPYISTANTATGTVGVDYWSGSAWVAVSSLVDGTAGMTATGFITFADTSTVAKQSVRDSLVLYWYRLTLTASASTALYYMTLSDVMQPIVDVWDGIEHNIASFQLKEGTKYVDYTNAVYDSTFSTTEAYTHCDLAGMTTSEDFAVGFSNRMSAVHLFFGGGEVNTTANTICAVYYWTGLGWSSVGTIVDGTASGGVSLAGTGIISWNPPSAGSEFRRSLNTQDDVQLYYYRFAFSKTLSGTVSLNYATGIPAPIEIKPYKFPISAMNRVFLCANQADKKNSVLCSAEGTADVYNGPDSVEILFGDGQEITAGCWLYSQYGTTLYNTMVFCKSAETHILVGNTPSTWAKYQVSPNIGCPAPQTMVVISAPLEIYGGSNRTVAIWQGTEGIYMFDGKGFAPIHLDIADYWDRRNSHAINRILLHESKGFYDQVNQEYHWLFASGTTSTTLNKELVYDVRRKKWFDIDRGSGKYLQCAASVLDLYGNTYNYGFIDTGYMERLEYGLTFDGSDITCEFALADMPLNDTWDMTTVRSLILYAVAKTTTANTITFSHTGDTQTTPSTFTMSPQNSGKRVAYPLKSLSAEDTLTSVFHRFGFSLTTNDELTGFEPLHLAIKYRKARDRFERI